MMIELQDIIAISGKRGVGKSYLVRYLIQNLSNYMDIVIYDINNEYRDLRKKALVLKINSLHDYKRLLDDFVPMKDTFYIFEDIDTIVDQFSMPETLKDFIYRGRHKNSGGIFVFRRLANIHKQILFNSHYLFMFRTHLFLDIKYLEQYINGFGERIAWLNNYEFLCLDMLQDRFFIAKIDGQYMITKERGEFE